MWITPLTHLTRVTHLVRNLLAAMGRHNPLVWPFLVLFFLLVSAALLFAQPGAIKTQCLMKNQDLCENGGECRNDTCHCQPHTTGHFCEIADDEVIAESWAVSDGGREFNDDVEDRNGDRNVSQFHTSANSSKGRTRVECEVTLSGEYSEKFNQRGTTEHAILVSSITDWVNTTALSMPGSPRVDISVRGVRAGSLVIDFLVDFPANYTTTPDNLASGGRVSGDLATDLSEALERQIGHFTSSLRLQVRPGSIYIVAATDRDADAPSPLVSIILPTVVCGFALVAVVIMVAAMSRSKETVAKAEWNQAAHSHWKQVRLKHYRAEKQRRARAEWTALVKRAQKHRVDQARRRRRRKQRKQARHPYTQGAAAVTRKGRGSSVTGSEVMSGLSLGGKPRSVASPVDVPVRSRAVTRSTGSTRHTRTKAQSSSRQLHQSNSAKSRDASSPGLSGQHQAASGHSAAGKRDLLQPPSRRSSHRLDKQPSLRRHPDFHSMSRRNSVSRRNLVSRRNSRSQPSNRLSSDVQPASNRDSRTRMRQLLVDCHTAMLTDDLATCSEV